MKQTAVLTFKKDSLLKLYCLLDHIYGNIDASLIPHIENRIVYNPNGDYFNLYLECNTEWTITNVDHLIQEFMNLEKLKERGKFE